MQELIHDLLVKIGEDPEREGLIKTPERVERSWKFLTRGYTQDLQTVVNGALFEAESDDMVIVKDIEFFSMCEHHLLPFLAGTKLKHVHSFLFTGGKVQNNRTVQLNGQKLSAAVLFCESAVDRIRWEKSQPSFP